MVRKSFGVYRARAERQKCGLAERKFAGPTSMLVKLQRPPPEMRIFSPIRVAWSINTTRRPRCPASAAHSMPAAPAPMIATSNFLTLRLSHPWCRGIDCRVRLGVWPLGIWPLGVWLLERLIARPHRAQTAWAHSSLGALGAHRFRSSSQSPGASRGRTRA